MYMLYICVIFIAFNNNILSWFCHQSTLRDLIFFIKTNQGNDRFPSEMKETVEFSHDFN